MATFMKDKLCLDSGKKLISSCNKQLNCDCASLPFLSEANSTDFGVAIIKKWGAGGRRRSTLSLLINREVVSVREPQEVSSHR